MERCRTCRWWITGDALNTHGVCEKIEHDAKEEGPTRSRPYEVRVQKRERAYIMGYGDYDSWLYTSASFGCILHEPEPTPVDHVGGSHA